VQAMLVMIDAIHCKLRGEREGFTRLIDIDEPPVKFQSLELKNYGLSDSLYIKMNGRGKPLTTLETFRARFEQLLLEVAPDRKEEFADKMDGSWTDLFWHYRSKSYQFDDEFMNLFRAVAINRYALQNDARSGSKVIEQRLVGYLSNPGFSELKELNCFSAEGINDIIDTLDILSGESTGVKHYLANSLFVNETKQFKDLISGSRDFAYAQRIQFFAITQYAIQHGSEKIEEWARVIRNLTVNISYSGADEFMRDIKAVEAMLPAANDIVQYLTSNAINGFMIIQREEEMIKANLIQKSTEWKDAIVKAENHGYFTGQIGFLLKFAGIKDAFEADNSMNWNAEQDVSFLKAFREYAAKVLLLFGDDGLLDFPDFIFERALLSKGDYLISHGLNESFLINAHREISWKRYLRDDYARRLYLKDLLDALNTESPIEYQLLNIIEYAFDDKTLPRWRMQFIKYNGMIHACGRERYIRFGEEDDILLLETSRTSGYHKECFSFALKLRLEALGHKVTYSPVASIKEMAGISHIDGNPISIYYYRFGDQWQYKSRTNEEEHLWETEDDIFGFLYANGYIKL
jgi:hypothetical protein